MTRSISARCCENITSSVCKKMGENIERITAQDVPSYLTIDLILKMVQSAEQTTAENPQNLRRAKAMVACGSVFDVRKVNGMGFAVEGYVAAETHPTSSTVQLLTWLIGGMWGHVHVSHGATPIAVVNTKFACY